MSTKGVVSSGKTSWSATATGITYQRYVTARYSCPIR